MYWALWGLGTYRRLTQRTSIPSMSSMNLLLTETRASCGHAWNQSIAVQLTMAGNFRALTRSVWPTGEKQKTICREQGEGGQVRNNRRMHVSSSTLTSQTMREGARPDTLVSYPSPGHWCKAASTFRVVAPQGRQKYNCAFLKMWPFFYQAWLMSPLRVGHFTCSLKQVTSKLVARR